MKDQQRRDRDRYRDPDECPWRPPDDNYYPSPPGNPGRNYPDGRGVSPQSIARCVYPVVEHGLKEAKATGSRHAMMEVALMSYLMGMGFNYNTAYNIVEYWEYENIITFDK
ncbi:MAG: hypothetical protein ACOCRZ_07150 [Halothermotrichaceae bacterium]